MAESHQEGRLQPIEKLMIERYVFNAEEPTQHLNGKFVVLYSIDVLAELFDHDFLHDWLDHSWLYLIILLNPIIHVIRSIGG